MNQRVVDNNFGDLLLSHRNARGLTQRALSAALSERGSPVDPTSITRMENGQREPRLSEALAISSYLGFELTDVTGGHDLSYFGHRDAAQSALGDARAAVVRCFDEARLSQVVWDGWETRGDDTVELPLFKLRPELPNVWLEDDPADGALASDTVFVYSAEDEQLLERVKSAVCRILVERGHILKPGESVRFGDWSDGADS